jgi:glutathione synthase/RimK-type ligase-like ATP-grasp enzyme
MGWDAVLVDWRDASNVRRTLASADVLVHRYLGSLRAARLAPLRTYLNDLCWSFGGPVVNDPAMLEYGVRKNYLLHLQERGFPVVPTRLVPATHDLDTLLGAAAGAGWGETVVKPVDGELCQDVYLLSRLTAEKLATAASRTDALLLQPFLPGIVAGQRSVFLIISAALPHVIYGMLKVPQGWHAKASLSRVIEVTPSSEEIDLATLVVSDWPPGPIMHGFARVDFVHHAGAALILEVETVNPEGGLGLARTVTQRQYAERFAEMLRGLQARDPARRTG